MVVPAETSTTFSCDTSQRHEAISIKLKLCGGKKKSAFGDLWVCVIHVTRNSPVLFEIFQYGLKSSSDPLTGQQVCRHKDVCRNSQHRSWGSQNPTASAPVHPGNTSRYNMLFLQQTTSSVLGQLLQHLKSPPVTLTGTLLGC